MDTNKYKDIRPLISEEIPGAVAVLMSIPELRQVYEGLGLKPTWDELRESLQQCHSVEDFKRKASYHWVKHVMAHFCQSVELTGVAQITKEGAYTYISNHRDIILDSAFLNVLLADAGAGLPRIAIGDNLMLYPWIETLVKLNGSFLVRRNLQGREVLLAARLLSEYMHDAIKDGLSVWIAQREGRAKDSSDHTQPALLKMLALGGETRDLEQSLRELNIVPVTCSYEFDPCDYLKAQEMQLKRDVEGFKKSKADDGINMKTGLFGWKGRVSFHMGRPLNELLALHPLTADAGKDPVEQLAKILDAEIHRNYRLYPINYIALDLLDGEGTAPVDSYTSEEKEKALHYIEERIALVQLPEGLTPDASFLQECLLTMYANPARNKLRQLGSAS